VVNSLWVSSVAAVIGLAVGFPVAWLAARTTMPGRRLVSGGMWLAPLLPSWLPAIGWERLVQTDGVMYRLGLDWPWVTHLIMGPLSQLLYAPGSPPASIAIEDNLSNHHFGVGMAQAVLAVFIAFLVVAVTLGSYRLLAPAGWRRIGGTVRG